MKYLKSPFLLLILAYIAACFAWIHGGWYGIVLLFFFGPMYFIWALILCIVTRYREHKFPSFVANQKIRAFFTALLLLLISQLIIMPSLGDSSDGVGVWSIFNGGTLTPENSQLYNNASLFLITTNVGIVIVLIALTVVTIVDRKKLRR